MVHADYRKIAIELGRAMSGGTSSNVGEDWCRIDEREPAAQQAQTPVANLKLTRS